MIDPEYPEMITATSSMPFGINIGGLIQKIGTSPVADPEFRRREPVEGCHGPMTVIAFIGDQEVIKRVLAEDKHPQQHGLTFPLKRKGESRTIQARKRGFLSPYHLSTALYAAALRPSDL
jgi:hypothetical protein